MLITIFYHKSSFLFQVGESVVKALPVLGNKTGSAASTAIVCAALLSFVIPVLRFLHCCWVTHIQ